MVASLYDEQFFFSYGARPATREVAAGVRRVDKIQRNQNIDSHNRLAIKGAHIRLQLRKRTACVRDPAAVKSGNAAQAST